MWEPDFTSVDTSVVDLKLFITDLDLDSTFQWVLDPGPTFKKLQIQFRICLFSW
jgi:hypothetical protein